MARTKELLVLGDTMKALVIALTIFSLSWLCVSQGQRSSTLGEIKRWRLHTEHGDIEVKLSSTPKGANRHSVLSLTPDSDSIPTVNEEAALVRQVLHGMASLHYDPRKLEMISTWLQNSEYRDGIEHTISQSGIWKSCEGRKYCPQAEHIADQYLSSVDAFKDFDAVLQEYGLKRKDVRVDDMAVGVKEGKILCQGLIVISLEHEK